MLDENAEMAWNAAYWLMRSEARRQLDSRYPDCDWNQVEESDEYVTMVVNAQARVCGRAMQGPHALFERYAWRMLTSKDRDRDAMDALFMEKAVELAIENVKSRRGGPFGALVVSNGGIIGSGANRVVDSNDPTAHAEIIAIRMACEALETFQLDDCDIYTTCEPCPMCMGAIYWARPRRVIYAASREDARAAGFDDEYIYSELALPAEKRAIEMVHVPTKEVRQAFEAWLEDEERVDY